MEKLRQSKIVGYAVGDLGINLNFQMVGFYLAYFYTDVFGISPGHVAGLFLAARVWDAVNDPLMGFIADRTRTRRGQFRPYLLFGAIPLSLLLVACFTTPDISPTAKVIYAYVTYIAHGMAFTLVGLPYSSISAVMTQDPQERAVISAYRMFFAVIVALSVVSIGVKPFVSRFATEQQGFAAVAGLFAVACTLLLWFAYWQSEERVQPPRETYDLKQFFRLVFQNDMLLVLAVAMFLNTCVWVIGNAVAMYYFKYILRDESLVVTYFTFMLPANILGVIVTPMVTKVLGKTRTFIIGSAAVAVLFAARHFVPPNAMGLFLGISMAASIGLMFCSITQWGMLPDTVEYGEWKTGVRTEGVPFSLFSFTQKLGLAVGGAFAAFVLDQTGYLPGDIEGQPQAALTGIKWLFNLVPAGFSVLCLSALLFYKLDGALHSRILGELGAKKTTAR